MPFFPRAFLGAYGAVWGMATPLLRRHTRLRDGFAQRLVPPDWPYGSKRPAGPRIWIQAASGGEARLAHTLAQALGSFPNCLPLSLLCTTCTRQGLDVLEALPEALPGKSALTVFPRYFPLDAPRRMAEALRRAAPDCIVLLETELWPGLLSAAGDAGVPVLVLNGRMTEKSLAGYRLFGSFWKRYSPARILAVSEEDARRFAVLFGERRVGIMPNMKFAALLPGTDGAEAALPPRSGRPDADALPRIGFASVRKEEEALLVPVIAALLANAPQGRAPLITVAPRHMHRVASWQKRLSESGIQVALRSEAGAGENRTSAQVLLWDTFGELHTLYACLDAVFVGGSLAPLGGQNFLEPLCHGVIPCVGPHWDNFHWVGRELFDAGLAVEVRDAGRLAVILREQTQWCYEDANPAVTRERRAETARQRFQTWLTPRSDGGGQAAQALLATLWERAERPEKIYPGEYTGNTRQEGTLS